MNDPRTPAPPPAPGLPRGLAAAGVILLTLQLALGYLQGGLLHRQHGELQSLRADLQDLTEALEQSQGSGGGTVGGERWSFTRRTPGPGPRYRAAGMAVLGSDDDERAQKELQQSRDSAKKAVQEGRKAQEQLSITENARKADEKARMDSAQNQWQRWSLAGAGLVVLAFVLRGWWRRRG